jgi:midasin (ATPase involved in ribosome maturation)
MVMQCNSYPLDELPQIVYRRCGIAPKQAQLMVTVLEQLKSQRAIAGIFASSSGLMTLR